MDELVEMIEKALAEGTSLHVRFQVDGQEWILSMSRRENRA